MSGAHSDIHMEHMDKKKMIVAKKKKTAGILALVLAVLLAFIPACRTETAASLLALSSMTGKGKLIEKTNGLKKLDNSAKASFIKSVKEKYTIKAVSDCSDDVVFDIKAKMPIESMGGTKMSTKIKSNIQVQNSRTSGLLKSEGKLKASVMFVSMEYEKLSYIDLKKGIGYSKFSGPDEVREWKKEQIKLKEDKGGIPFFDPDMVIEVYQNSKTGAYVAIVDMDEDAFEKMTGSGISTLKEMGVKEVDLSKSSFLMTFDKDLSVVGMYADLTKSITGGENISVSDCKMKVTVTGINTGVKITLPDEVKNIK